MIAAQLLAYYFTELKDDQVKKVYIHIYIYQKGRARSQLRGAWAREMPRAKAHSSLSLSLLRAHLPGLAFLAIFCTWGNGLPSLFGAAEYPKEAARCNVLERVGGGNVGVIAAGSLTPPSWFPPPCSGRNLPSGSSTREGGFRA